MSIGADLLKQIIWSIKIRRAPTKHDNIDFKSIIKRTSEIKPLSVAVADKGYDSEENHVLVREDLKAYCIIPPRYAHVPIWRTHDRYRKQIMKREYPKLLYNQRNKDDHNIICHKETVWRIYYFKASKNTKQGTIIQMYCL